GYLTGAAVIQNSTIANNTVSGSGGGGGIAFFNTNTTSGATVNLASTVVANNTATGSPDVSGTVTANNSLIRDQTGTTLATGTGAEFQNQRSSVTSLTVTFSGLVSFSGATAAAFKLSRVSGGTAGDVALTAQDVSTPTQTVIKLTFSGGLTEGAASLQDGNYQ